jgi:hypothetical protein
MHSVRIDMSAHNYRQHLVAAEQRLLRAGGSNVRLSTGLFGATSQLASQ